MPPGIPKLRPAPRADPRPPRPKAVPHFHPSRGCLDLSGPARTQKQVQGSRLPVAVGGWHGATCGGQRVVLARGFARLDLPLLALVVLLVVKLKRVFPVVHHVDALRRVRDQRILPYSVITVKRNKCGAVGDRTSRYAIA